MRIEVAGNVGIGTTAPGSKLHVSRGAAGYAPNANSGLTVEHSGNVYANVISAAGETGVLFGSAANAAHGGIVYNSIPGLMFRTGGNLERMRIDANGNVGIGTNAPGVTRLRPAGSKRFRTAPRLCARSYTVASSRPV